MRERLYGELKVNSMAGLSIASDRHPERNEDTYFTDFFGMAVGVFDGMGGHAGSERASRIAAHTSAEHLFRVPFLLAREIGRRVVFDAMLRAHNAIVHDMSGDIGTTAAVVKILDDGRKLYASIGHVGDSRAYVMRDGDLSQLTLDNVSKSYVNYGHDERQRDVDKWRTQDTLSRVTDVAQLNDEERLQFRRRNIISSCLGSRDGLPYIAVTDIDVTNKDRLIVTSDGVHDNLTTNEIACIVRDSNTADIITRELVYKALERSRDKSHLRAKPDDITAVALII